MIIYNPQDGLPLQYPIRSQARHCFLMTRLGNPIPPMVGDIRTAVTRCCRAFNYTVIDAQARVTGRDILLKIWRQIASTPLSVGVLHEDIPASTQANIFYELGVAQALGKETVIIRSPGAVVPSDFSGIEHIPFDDEFTAKFEAYLETVFEQADYYELMSDLVENNPVLALDFLQRAFLIKGDDALKEKARDIISDAGLEERAKNSVELLAAAFARSTAH